MASLAVSAGASALGRPDQREVLYTLDLTATLRLDRGDPRQLRRIWDEAHFAASVQGIANRKHARLYIFYVGGDTGRIDRYWFDNLRAKGGWLAGKPTAPIGSAIDLARIFRDDLKGVVVYDERVPATSCVASTIAGVEQLGCVRYDPTPGSVYDQLTQDPSGPRLPIRRRLINFDGTPMFTGRGRLPDSNTPSTGSAKCDAYLWAKERYLDTGLCNPRKMAYYLDAWWLRNPEGYIPNHTLTNHDYFIAERAFFFDLSPWDDETPVDEPDQPVGADCRALQAILRAAYDRLGGRSCTHVGGFVPWGHKYTNYGKAGGRREGVPAEWRYAEILSCFNAYMDADALGLSAMANASIYRLFPLASVYPQVKPTIDSLRARGLVLPDGRVAPRSYVAIYGGDYDSAAWLYQRLPDIWSDPARGKVPIGWAFNPNLAERAAPMMAYARRSATPADVFIAGDNGAGYLNPSYLVPPRPWSGLPSGLAAWEAHCRRFFRQWGLSLTGFLIDGNARPSAGQVLDAYGRFSPDGVIGQKTPRLGMHASMPLLRMEWDLYDAAKGAEVIASRTRAAKPEFFMYRTILWSPTDLKRMVDLVKSGPAGRDVEFVDPHTLMLLVKQFHAGPDAGKTRPVKPIIPRPGERGSLWDVRRGLEVTGHSGIVDGCDPRDMFGGTYGSLEDHATVLFADGTDAGTLHWIEWRLPFKMSLEEVRLQAHGDDNGSTNREFDEVRLSARVGGAWRQVGMVRPSHPFTFVNRDTATMWTLRLPSPVTASEFRAEFTQHAAPGLPNMGPRIREVIGIGVAAP